MGKKNIKLTTEDAELIAEALDDAIEKCYEEKTDGDVFSRAPALRKILDRIIDRYELPDPWSDRPDLGAMDKVKGMDPDRGSA